MRDGFHIAGGATAQYTMRDLVALIVGEEKRSDIRPAPAACTRAGALLDGVRIAVYRAG